MIIITYRPLYCVFALKLGIPSRKFLAPPLTVVVSNRQVFLDKLERKKVQITHLKYVQSPDNTLSYFLVQFGI